MTKWLVLTCALLASGGGSPDARLPVVVGRIEPYTFPLGPEASWAFLWSRGWIGNSQDDEDRIHRILVERPGAKKAGVALTVTDAFMSLRRTPRDIYVHLFTAKDQDGWLARVEGSLAVRLSGPVDAEWFADTPAGLRALHTGPIAHEYRWQLYAVEKTTLRPLGDEHRGEMTFGLVALPGELLVAAGDEQPYGAPAAAHSPRGRLLHLTTDGKVVREEPFPDRRPAGIALTDDGWIVVLGWGTPAHEFKDGTVVARKVTPAGAEPGPWRLLANQIEIPSNLIQRGGWTCFEERSAETAVFHCINPNRGLHVVTPRLRSLAVKFDIDPRGGHPCLVFRQPRDDGREGRQTVAMPLP